MDIKLKKMNKYTLTKILLFAATVIMLTAACLVMENIVVRDDYRRSLATLEKFNNDNYTFLYRDMIEDIVEGHTIKPSKDFIYYCKTIEGSVYTNVKNSTVEYFKDFSNHYLIYENKQAEFEKTNNREYWFENKLNGKADQLYLSFTENYIKQQEHHSNMVKEQVNYFLIVTTVLVILSIILIIIQMFMAGRDPINGGVQWERIDKLYVDVQLICAVVLGIIWVFAMRLCFSDIDIYAENPSDLVTIALAISGLINVFTITMFGFLFLSLCRKYKSGILLKHTLVYVVMRAGYNFSRELFTLTMQRNMSHTNRLFLRSIIFIAASMIQVLCFIFFLAYTALPLSLMAVFLEFTFIYWYISSNNKTYHDINEGIDDIREEQLKAERMRVDLVANVSHDLKTPLTSIISYLDLLEKEELNESASDYVKILEEKSQRLKKIVEDLFDLSKSTSGNMPVKLENIDMKKLVEQTLADMQDIISQKEKQIVTNLPQDGVLVYGDSDKLYRVFQNLLDNALKYSLENTRIFIDLMKQNGTVKLIIKNTASYEMNFKADEIVQRFQRGDDSRNTEGSGLGLAIAESFTRNFGGTLQVHIDGDMFRVEINFPK